MIAEAADGTQAVELCKRLRPDPITTEMVLPVLTGRRATEYIRAYCPTPLLIVSTLTDRGEKTYQGLAAAVVDVVEGPLDDERDQNREQAFLTTIGIGPTRRSLAASAERGRP